MSGQTEMRFAAKLVIGLLISVCTLLFVATNVRLFHAAATSKPDCIPHVRLGQAGPVPGLYTAAQSACSPVQWHGDGT